MFPTPSQTTVSHSLLTEVARSGAFPDAGLFVYGVLGALVLACLIVGCLTAGRSTGGRPSDGGG